VLVGDAGAIDESAALQPREEVLGAARQCIFPESPYPTRGSLGLLRRRGWRTWAGEATKLVRAFAEAEDFWRLLRHAVLPEVTLDYHDIDSWPSCARRTVGDCRSNG
jgi:hypothetical protein